MSYDQHGTPQCDGWCQRTGTPSMIDTAGFIYCEPCGMTRRQYEPCRKLRPHELRRIEHGRPLAHY